MGVQKKPTKKPKIFFRYRTTSHKDETMGIRNCKFNVNVHTISLCIVKKSSLKNTFTICQKTSVCRTQDLIFSILNLGGFRLLLAIFIVRESKKQHFYPGDTIYTSIFLKIHVHILIVMLRIFLALIVLGNKLHHHLD